MRLPTGECPECGGRFAIRETGVIREHHTYLGSLCRGTSKLPVDGTLQGSYR